MRTYLLTGCILLFTSGVLLASTYRWQAYINGVHPVEIHLQQKAQALAGYWVLEQDTFGLEGQIKSDEIHLLEFYNGLWTASLQIELKDGKPQLGYWFSREKKETYWVGFEPALKTLAAVRKFDRSNIGKEIISSQISARDACVHYIDHKKEWQFRQYLLTDSIRVFGTAPKGMKALLQFGQASDAADMRSLLKGDYFRLIELFLPRFNKLKLDSFLYNRGVQLLNELKTQGRSLELQVPNEERDRYRWYWNAYSYVEVYQWNKKRISFIIHTKDFKGKNRAESIHWDLKKDQRIYLSTELKNPDAFQAFCQRIMDRTHQVALHDKGVILVSSFSPEHGIKRIFVPNKTVDPFYRFFSKLKWWRR